jgi:hypothetical protein
VVSTSRLFIPYLSKKQPKAPILSLLAASTSRLLIPYLSKSNQNHLFLPFWWPTILGYSPLDSSKATKNIYSFPFGGRLSPATHPFPLKSNQKHQPQPHP